MLGVSGIHHVSTLSTSFGVSVEADGPMEDFVIGKLEELDEDELPALWQSSERTRFLIPKDTPKR